MAQIGLSAPRVAVIFDGGVGWHYWARLVLHVASRTWGGRGFLLVPHVDGAVDPVLLQAARRYDPDYVVLLETTLAQIERVAPGSVPLTVEGAVLDNEARAQLLEQAGDQVVPDPAGERAREAVARVCSPYRRSHERTDTEESLASLGVGGLDNTFTPLTPLSAIPAVAGAPYLSAPAGWDGPLGVLVAAGCGLFDEPQNGAAPPIGEKDEQLLLSWLLFGDDPAGTRPADPLLKWLLSPANDGNDGTAFQRTTFGLSRVSTGVRPRHHATFVVGDTAADFAAAYAHQVLYGDGWWLPAELSPVGNNGRAGRMRHLLHSRVITKAAFRHGRVTVTSVSAGAETVTAAVEALRVPPTGLGGHADAEQRKLLEAAVVAGDLAFPADGVTSYAVTADLDHPVAIPAMTEPDGTITMMSPVPVPDVADPGLRDAPGLTWQVEVRCEGPGMPAGRGLQGAHLATADVDPFLTWIRSGRHGPRFESHRYNLIVAGTPRLSQLARPKLRILSLHEWAGRLAVQHQHSIRVSDAGRRANVLQALLGGRENLAATFSGPLLSVLRGFLRNSRKSSERYRDGEGAVLHAAGTNDAGYEGYLTFEGVKAFGSRSTDEAVAADIDRLTGSGLLTRGIIVNCEQCGRVAFISLGRAGQDNICPRCGAANPLTSARWHQPVSGPPWYFDLHPVARDLLRDHGEVPLQLADYLRSRSRRYTDAAELELCNSAGSPIAEIDLPAYADGQVVIAEAKSSSTLGNKPAKEVQKKATAADLVQADQLIFATSESAWEAASLTAIRTTVRAQPWTGGQGPAVRIITGLGTERCQDRRMDLADGALSDW
ncbi:hypothetical protein [Micromonospora sp. NPDC005172]|uniref:hypothetical protein n=1 Tax=Micromonospora sp. NPDC005172 TaxID=3156867 RepID=UPI0033BEF342